MQITSSNGLRKALIELLDKREDKTGKYWELAKEFQIRRTSEHRMFRRVISNLISSKKLGMELTEDSDLELTLIG